MLQGNKIVHDTCGVNNLHGMPGILGGICGAISACVAGDTAYGESIATIWIARDPAGDNRSAGEQGGYQALALVISICFALVGGLVTGAFVNFLRSSCFEGPKNFF